MRSTCLPRARWQIPQPPFYHENHQELYRRVLEGVVQFPAGVSDVSKSLVVQLLDKNPATRLGARLNGQCLRVAPFRPT